MAAPPWWRCWRGARSTWPAVATPAPFCAAGAERLSLDHKPSLPEEMRRIQDVGGFVKNGRVQGQLAVSRAIGDANFAPLSPDPYVHSVEIGEDHTTLCWTAMDGVPRFACRPNSTKPSNT